MAIFRTPKGTYSRSTPDLYIDRMMGMWLQGVTSTSALLYIGVYNDATDGSALYMYGLECNASVSTLGVIEMFQGAQGATLQPAFPLRADKPTGPGKAITFTNAVCIGSHLGYLPAFTAQYTFWPYPWPYAVVPPGWGCAWQSGSGNLTGEVGMQWLPLRDPGNS